MVEEVIRHPDYNNRSLWDSDVALLRLGETVIMNDVVRPICLPNSNDDYDLVRFKLGMPGLKIKRIAVTL